MQELKCLNYSTMCTAIILSRPGHRWPLILAANRDEMESREWESPGRHWSNRPDVVGGRDKLAGGSWLGINDDGVIATVLNRPKTLGPRINKRSRGELVLEALDHATAQDAAKALAYIDPKSYRAFNLIIADSRDAFWIRHDEIKNPTIHPIAKGLSMITNIDINDKACPRINHHRTRFAIADPPNLETGDIFSWECLLADTINRTKDAKFSNAICIEPISGYGTVSSSIIGLPNIESTNIPVFLFSEGRPGLKKFTKIQLTKIN
jgi:uncharacterized protein with NRDE domain